MVIGHGIAVGVEGVGFDDIGSGIEKLPVYFSDHIGLCEHQQIVITFQGMGIVLEAIAPVSVFVGALLLYHGSHGTVDYEDAAGE